MTTDEYQYWLFYMYDRLEELDKAFAADTGDHLDLTIAHLAPFESWLLGRHESVEAISREENVLELDAAARFVGEVIRKEAGGQWRLESNPELAYFGHPVIDYARGFNICPIYMVTASMDRRTGEYLTKILRTIQRRAEAAKLHS